MNLWVEKHRPKSIGQLVGDNDLTRIIGTGAQVSNLPNLILYGPPGTGKTSLVRILCRKLFKHPRHIDERVLELNASDDRGISVVRTQIKTFASKLIQPVEGIPDFKVVVLEEADAMTDDSQAALRRVMEVHNERTRFIILCNYVGRIIKPLLSRCVHVKFVHASDANTAAIINGIVAKEHLRFAPGALEPAIAFLRQVTSGDMRKMINVLQRANYVANLKDEPIDMATIRDVANCIPAECVDHLLSAAAASPDAIIAAATSFVASGYSFTELLLQLNERILASPDVPEEDKARAMVWIGEADAHNVQNLVQLIGLLMRLRSCLNSGGSA